MPRTGRPRTLPPFNPNIPTQLLPGGKWHNPTLLLRIERAITWTQANKKWHGLEWLWIANKIVHIMTKQAMSYEPNKKSGWSISYTDQAAWMWAEKKGKWQWDLTKNGNDK